eukprot:Blabericola_migrator_1__406@NODE_10_length_25093_cov_104_131184_g7_i2_p22_GENE_NODE_10_length_25093_cov_104_131184_g7_i2NODE_10_length_25093_cov_104_131184_g7_i2_p22_ORF_typecomplete_len128_score10_76Methyltrans_RNA/PF04452_14/0_0053ERp29/PF07749_12/0_13_NODE_10_length_25093_cov_104_131184_g7_i265786961
MIFDLAHVECSCRVAMRALNIEAARADRKGRLGYLQRARKILHRKMSAAEKERKRFRRIMESAFEDCCATMVPKSQEDRSAQAVVVAGLQERSSPSIDGTAFDDKERLMRNEPYAQGPQGAPPWRVE